MQGNDSWSNFEAINGVINTLVDHKMKKTKINSWTFLKNLKRFKCKLMPLEAFMKQLMVLWTC